jgi:nitrile hydratase accessory protein
MTEKSDPNREYSMADPPIGDDRPVFESPWQARAFALAVVLSDHQESQYSWKTFQSNLVDEVEDNNSIGDYSEEIYYEQWLHALERIILNDQLINVQELQQRVDEFASGDRDASEFIEGEHEHHHDDGHSHDH